MRYLLSCCGGNALGHCDEMKRISIGNKGKIMIVNTIIHYKCCKIADDVKITKFCTWTNMIGITLIIHFHTTFLSPSCILFIRLNML